MLIPRVVFCARGLRAALFFEHHSPNTDESVNTDNPLRPIVRRLRIEYLALLKA